MEFELAQESVKASNELIESSESIKQLCKQIVSEGVVLLENDGLLPLNNKKIALFGRCQINSFYAGYGSGGDVKAGHKVSILEGLMNIGCDVNQKLANEYINWTKNNVPDEGTWGCWPLCFEEMPIEEEFIKTISTESEAAVVVIGRSAGEDRDIKVEKGSWYLNDNEVQLLTLVKKYFSKICVLINSGSIMDMTQIKSFNPNAVAYIWQGGQEMGNGVAEVLFGNVSPSGKLTDTIADIYDYPSTKYFANPDFSIYGEDIYVGYRYFNTFKKDKIIYPFGYGLSYTKFSIETLNIDYKNYIYNIDVKVKNIGNYKGKEVVQIYLSKPQNKLGNPAVELVAYKKTKVLEENEEQILNIKIDLTKFSSYDDLGLTGYKNCFVLEDGTYKLFIGTDSINLEHIHEATIDNTILIQQTLEACAPLEAFERMVNKNGITYENVEVGSVDIKERILSLLPQNNEVNVKNYHINDVINNKITLDEFVDSLDVEELEALTRGSLYAMNSPYGPLGNAGTFAGSNEKLFNRGIPAVCTNDGPSGIRLAARCTLIPNGITLASSFNDELVEELMYHLGLEVEERKSHVILAPGLNIHRSPLCGRNFEYYSEDPYLSGKMAAAYVKGIQKTKTSACPKHFAGNSQEFNRHVHDSKMSQRALREIYIRGFQICIDEAKPNVIMTSYNKINGEYAYYSHDLIKIILRDEMKFEGLIITDWWMKYGKSKYFNLETQAYRIRATLDVYMPGSYGSIEKIGESDGTIFKAIESNDLTIAELRYCAKNVVKFCLKHII